MVKRKSKPSHLEKRYNTYFAIIYVPKDLQTILGKTRISETTGTGNLRIAENFAQNFVFKWRLKFDSLRQNSDDPILKSALQLKEAFHTSSRHLVQDVIEEERDRIQREQGNLVADIFEEVALGKGQLLDEYLKKWRNHQIERSLKLKTIDQMERDIKSLLEYIKVTTQLDEVNVNGWLSIITKKNKLPSSISRIIGSCKNFYNYLQEIEVVSYNKPNPFVVPNKFRVSKSRNSKSVHKRKSYLPYKPNEIVNIYKHVVSLGENKLADLILLAMYTGARIEELCKIRVEDVDIKEMFINISDSKTRAGIREVPIHNDLLKTIKKLIKDSEDGYLISNASNTKYGNRSGSLGKKYGRIKSKLGYDRQHSFHSIRKTVTTQLENAGVLENLTADIVGHEKTTITYGLYSGGNSLKNKLEAINKISYDFS